MFKRHNPSVIASVAVYNAVSELEPILTSKLPKEASDTPPKALFITNLPHDEAKALIQSGNVSTMIVTSSQLADSIINNLHTKAMGA